jgi:hypothetical protein
MEQATQKSNLEGSTPLYTVRERWHFAPSSGGVFQRSVPLLRERWSFLGELWFVEINQARIPSISEVGWIQI